MIVALESEDVSAGPFALLIVALLLVVTVALIRNMGSRLRNLPQEFPDDPRGLRGDRVGSAEPEVDGAGDAPEPPESELRGS